MGWDLDDASMWDPAQISDMQFPPTQLTNLGTDTPETHGSAINVDDYEISDMEPNEACDPSPNEVKSGSRAKGKGKAKPTVTGTNKYTLEETKVVVKCYVDIFEDPIIGSGQRVKIFWERISEVYNNNKPGWALSPDWDNLCKHWNRVQPEISKYVAILYNVQKTEGKDFRYYDVYVIVRDHPKFSCGTDVAGTKRTKVNATRYYSSSGRECFDLNSPMKESCGTRPMTDARPMGQKAAKRKGKAPASTSQSEPEMDPSMKFMGEAMMMQSYATLVAEMKDMPEEDRAGHRNMMAVIRKKLGI